jgi:predicted LPLAT superfamily acyltransferase
VTDETKLHWTEEKEVVRSNRPIKLMVQLLSVMPLFLVHSLIFPVCFFYLLCSKRAREETIIYQKQFIKYTGGKKFKLPHPYIQILAFSLCVLEKIEGWSGKIKLDKVVFQNDDVDELKEQLAAGKGALLIGSHLGNIEMLRSLASYNRTGVDCYVPVTTIMDIKATAQFNKTMNELNPGVSMNVIDLSEISVDTMSRLSDQIQSGGLVVIAGDRTSAKSRTRSITESFLGKPALFPYGVFLIAALLNAPTYFVFGLRRRNVMLFPKYNMYVKKSTISFDCTRKERDSRIEQLCRSFVSLMEYYCKAYPFQWYNFYNFWAMPE